MYRVHGMKFRCIDHSGGTILFRLERAYRIVTTFNLLQNICDPCKTNVPIPYIGLIQSQHHFRQPDNQMYRGIDNHGAEEGIRLIKVQS